MSTVEMDCKWHFAQQLGGRDDGPNDPMQESFKKTPYASLIRESIQNSLDVPLDKSQPVRMSFSISGIDANNYPNFFELKKHIQGCVSYYSENEDARSIYQPMIEYLSTLGKYGKLSYIKISDYNTLGMDYVKGDTNLPFYAFVRAAGVSSKGDATAGGSFGYGKAAYFYISPIRTILVSTKTKEGKCFFEGVSSLCTHQLTGQEEKCVSVGYYDNNDGEPTSDAERIPNRFKRDDAGTDIYILGINASDKDTIYTEMIQAVLRNFWMAIYRSRLEVTIGDTTISSQNLSDLMQTYFPEELDTVRRESNYNPKPYLDAVMNEGCDNRHISIEETLPTIGKVKFYAVKDRRATDKVLYMRSPLMLVKAKRTQSSNGFFGVFICEDHIGNRYLRETENPAHNEWKSSNWRINGKIPVEATNAIKDVDEFIKFAMEKMFANRDKEVQSIQGLEEFLYIPTAIEEDGDDSESLVGDVVGRREDEGNAPSTELSDGTAVPASDRSAIGKVMIDAPDDTARQKDKSGDALSGHGGRKKKNRGGGGVTSRDVDGHYGDSNEGIKGKYLTEVPVRYRSFAQERDGRIIHNIIIHSEFDFFNGRIDLLIGGEQSDDKVSIERCNPSGVISGNTISGLHIVKGKNMLEVTFVDNMKHAIKLDAYELK